MNPADSIPNNFNPSVSGSNPPSINTSTNPPFSSSVSNQTQPTEPATSVPITAVPLTPSPLENSNLNQPLIPQENPLPVSNTHKINLNFLASFLIVLGPLTMFGLFGFSFYKLKTVPQKLPVQAPIAPVIKIETPEDYSRLAPFNPESVRAYADASKSAQLQSGESYSYDNPYFEWDETKTNEPGSKIEGYFVYFGSEVDENKLQEGFSVIGQGVKVVGKNYFSPQEYGLILTPGKTYRLLIQSFSNGKAKLGFDRELNLPSKIYFEYLYQ